MYFLNQHTTYIFKPISAIAQSRKYLMAGAPINKMYTVVMKVFPYFNLKSIYFRNNWNAFVE